jgi:hypothetical protein
MIDETKPPDELRLQRPRRRYRSGDDELTAR